jgi:hypothetical protein
VGGQQEDEKESGPPCSSPCWTVRQATEWLTQADAEANPEDKDKCPQDTPALGRT